MKMICRRSFVVVGGSFGDIGDCCMVFDVYMG